MVRHGRVRRSVKLQAISVKKKVYSVFAAQYVVGGIGYCVVCCVDGPIVTTASAVMNDGSC